MRFLFFLLIISLIGLSRATAQEAKVIQLKPEHISYAPKTYFISNVTDSIPDSAGIGTINDGGAVQIITLQGGTATALKNYVDQNITQDKSQPAVVMNIKELKVEIKKRAAKWTVNVSSTFVFYSGGVKLSQFSGSGQSEISSDPAAYLEKEIRRSVQRNLEDFEKWWVQQKDKFALSDQVKINATIGKTTDNRDFIIYSQQRPLNQRDFKGTVQEDLPEKATTYSGNLFATTSLVQKGQLIFSVVVTPYFDKSQSWYNPVNSNPYLLAHEQAHFDITAIKTCELVSALRNATFTKENYEDRFKQLTKQYENETTEEQNAYDSETNHGTIPDKPQAWQNKITQHVKASGCY